jgi:hypothetical protein
MSQANIISQIELPGGVLLIQFQCKDGSTPRYSYSGLAAAQILAGADPSTVTPDGSSSYGGE